MEIEKDNLIPEETEDIENNKQAEEEKELNNQLSKKEGEPGTVKGADDLPKEIDRENKENPKRIGRCGKCCIITLKILIVFCTIIIFITIIRKIMNIIKYREIDKYYNIEYGPFIRNKMDIYLPKKEDDNKIYGSILFIHGGMWVFGGKETDEVSCKDYALKGYVAAAMSFHYVVDDYTIWDIMDDIELAIKKLSEFVTEKKYKVNGTSLYGYSSGAHITTLFAYSRAEKTALPIKFIINKAGPTDFHSDTWKEWNYGEEFGPEIALLLSGKNNFKEYMVNGEIVQSLIPYEILENVINNVSSVYYINEKTVPSICIYPTVDKIVPTKNRILLLEKLEENNIKYDFIEFKNSNHFLEDDPETLKELDNKIAEYLKMFFGY